MVGNYCYLLDLLGLLTEEQEDYAPNHSEGKANEGAAALSGAVEVFSRCHLLPHK